MATWAPENLHQLSHSAVRREAWAEAQNAQLELFVTQGLPTRRHEAWKYTNLTALEKIDFALPAATQQHQQDLDAKQIPGTHRIVIIDGVFSSEHSTLDSLEDGLTITSLSDYSPQVGLIGSENPLTALNSGLITGGVVIEVTDNTVIKQPIHVLSIYTAASQHVMYHPRHLIIAGKQAEISVLYDCAGADNVAYFHNAVTQVHTAAGANVQITKLQREGNAAYHIANTLVQQARDSQVTTQYFTLGAKLSREDLHFDLQQQGAQCEMLGLYLLTSNQLGDTHSCVDHAVPHTRSFQHYKGIMHDQAKGVFNGKVVVQPQAQKTEAYQTNNNLLLGERAEINTKPELEIYADDVKCSHGATIGQLDPKALFYLRSRGIPEEAAKQMLLQGFVDEIFDAMPEGVVTEYVKEMVRKHA